MKHLIGKIGLAVVFVGLALSLLINEDPDISIAFPPIDAGAEIAPAPSLNGGPQDIVGMLILAAEANNLPPMLILGMAQVESNFQPTATSHAGAVGVLQIVPSAAGREVYRLMGRDGQPSSDALKDPRYNAEIATSYINWLIDYFSQDNGRVPAEIVVAAYKVGPTRVRNCIQAHREHWIQCLPLETRVYLDRVQQISGKFGLL